MKKIFILLIALLVLNGASAQSCLPEGILLTTQFQVDYFHSTYPNCTQIEGNVTISGYTITNLDGLSVITSIGGSLMIECNEALTSLAGLHNLTAIGDNLYLEGNMVLANLSGLENVTYIGGDVEFTDNVALTSLAGLEGLTSVNGKLWIDYNESLTNLAGLNNVESIAGILRIYANNSLVALSGLEGLTSIGGCLVIGGQGHLGGLGNPLLTSLMGLYNVTSVGGMIDIGYNSSLPDLAGLDNISAGSICSLFIYENDTLTACEVQGICDYLSSPTGNIFINNNATGCNTQAEVEAACIIKSIGNAKEDKVFTLFPNPSAGYVTIETRPSLSNSQLIVTDLKGRIIIMHQLSGIISLIDISNLPAGIYFARLKNDLTVEMIKIIKQ